MARQRPVSLLWEAPSYVLSPLIRNLVNMYSYCSQPVGEDTHSHQAHTDLPEHL